MNSFYIVNEKIKCCSHSFKLFSGLTNHKTSVANLQNTVCYISIGWVYRTVNFFRRKGIFQKVN